MSVDTLEEMKAAVKAIDKYHRSKGWQMAGYSYIVCQPRGRFKRAKIFECRGFDNVPAAQLNYNTGNGAICVLGDFSQERLKRNTIWRVGRLARRFKGSRLAGHFQVTMTDCPGAHIKQQLPRIAKIAGKKVL